jgi:polysaccharide export outer membrane protein
MKRLPWGWFFLALSLIIAVWGCANPNREGRDDLSPGGTGEEVTIWTDGDPGRPTVSDFRSLPEETEENRVFTTVSGYPEYKIGPNDLLEITYWRGNTATKEPVRVGSDGTISFGYIENLNVNGLTPTQVDEYVTKLMGEYIKHPRIDVFVKEYCSKFVTFMGAVGARPGNNVGPGKYELKGKAGLLEMLSVAGGPTEDANLQDVRVRRRNNQVFSLNLYKAIMQGDRSQDIILDDGDLVFIPRISDEHRSGYDGLRLP